MHAMLAKVGVQLALLLLALLAKLVTTAHP
jgi:hypothetical protein